MVRKPGVNPISRASNAQMRAMRHLYRSRTPSPDTQKATLQSLWNHGLAVPVPEYRVPSEGEGWMLTVKGAQALKRGGKVMWSAPESPCRGYSLGHLELEAMRRGDHVWRGAPDWVSYLGGPEGFISVPDNPSDPHIFPMDGGYARYREDGTVQILVADDTNTVRSRDLVDLAQVVTTWTGEESPGSLASLIEKYLYVENPDSVDGVRVFEGKLLGLLAHNEALLKEVKCLRKQVKTLKDW